jgi:hypothetical protein
MAVGPHADLPHSKKVRSGDEFGDNDGLCRGMTMRRLLLVPLLLACFTANAVVIRHDVPDARYRVEASECPALVDLPGEGHGVLIAPRWVVTAAHAVQWGPVERIEVGGRPRKVARMVVHPGFQRMPPELGTGDAAPLMVFLAASDDIALIELAKPVRGVAPIALHRGTDERGQVAMLCGKGASGNGRDGQDATGGNRTLLRRAFNRIEQAEGRWLDYRFDEGESALPLEGMLGNGDSGGPVLIDVDGEWQLAGVASWKHWTGDLAGFRAGIYGQTSHHVRISHYVEWIAQHVDPD